MSSHRISSRRVSVVAVWPCLFLAAPAASAHAGETPNFIREVRPILATNCLPCHGPDAEHRAADLRLDIAETVGDIRGIEAVAAAGNPDESELLARVASDDPDLRMPPTDSGKELKPAEIDILRRWVAAGAGIEQHWAFVAPKRPQVPPVVDASWVHNPIDAFILARLEREGMRPAPPAEPPILLRRLSLDLVGLPPAIEEIDSFALEHNEAAYAREVDRLLASPHYGERWGRLWLDAARYADSDGFEKDKPRSVWMYRDWVINSLNADMPYDEFVIHQLAGDLLPEPSQDSRVATGFLRNSMINEEGGVDPEQFRMEAMFDRMDAIGKSVLGLTVQCAQCHNHKYDPITQTDYYRLFAFINNCDEGQIAVYTDNETAQWQKTLELIREIENGLRAEMPDWKSRMDAWERSLKKPGANWRVVRPEIDGSGGEKHYLLADGSILAQGYAPTKSGLDFTVTTKAKKITAFRLELLNNPNLPRGGPGRSIFGTCALTEFRAVAAPLGENGKRAELKIKSAAADVNPPAQPLDKTFDDRSDRNRITGPIQYAIDGDDLTAWTIDVGAVRSNEPHEAVFLLEKPLETPRGARVTFKLKAEHGGWNSDDNQTNNLGCFRFSVTSDDNPAVDTTPPAVRKILAIPPDKRSPDDADRLFSYWRTTVPEWAEANRRLEALHQSRPWGTTQLALIERETPRTTHRLDRGDFLKPAEAVSPGVPQFLHPLAADESKGGEPAEPTRLDFARWLVDRRSPTPARAIVNRIWQAYFGTGLVQTAEDLGTQSPPPSHPELLDWLAVELIDSGWRLKHIHRLIVHSATYRQHSAVSPELLERDPANELLARGPRFRVDAEVVRDIALAASGLLAPKIGGPSVYPPAPEFLLEPPASYGPKTWAYDTGPDKYRRALYTFRFRSVPYPMLQNFDAPTGDFACVRRVRSNTPLQALTTLNEPLFVECARALARKAILEGGGSDSQRLRYAVRRCLSREPDAAELQTLEVFLNAQRARFQQPGANPATLATGEEQQFQQSREVPAAELAAWTALSRVVLNLDETVTKE